MIEKIKISLWDLFAFFLSGLLLFVFVAGHLLSFEVTSLGEIKEIIFKLPASISLFIIPLVFTIAGLLLEPIANYFHRYIINPGWHKIFVDDEKHKEEERSLEKIIKDKYLESFEGIKNPYHICKEYVETRQLSTTFMVFLSRFGFYRNVSFLCFVSALVTLWHLDSWKTSVVIEMACGWVILAAIFKHRAQEFYGYLAPIVYRCFLIDRAFGDSANKKSKAN